MHYNTFKMFTSNDSDSVNAMIMIKHGTSAASKRAIKIASGNVVEIDNLLNAIYMIDWSVWKYAVTDNKEYSGCVVFDGSVYRAHIICGGDRDSVRTYKIPNTVPIHSHPKRDGNYMYPSVDDFIDMSGIELLVTDAGVCLFGLFEKMSNDMILEYENRVDLINSGKVYCELIGWDTI